jgi:hypothetical protein
MIFGLTGKKRAGKSTACKYLEEKTGAVRINFKDALVAEIEQNFPRLIEVIIETLEKYEWDGKPWTYERLVEEKPPLFRALMQNYGTEVRRNDDPDYWVQQWKARVEATRKYNLRSNPPITTDDVRFLNEAEAVKDFGGVIIKIERTDVDMSDGHSSEMEMDAIIADETISVKTGEHDKLYTRLDWVLKEDSTPRKLNVIHE